MPKWPILEWHILIPENFKKINFLKTISNQREEEKVAKISSKSESKLNQIYSRLLLELLTTKIFVRMQISFRSS